MDQDDYAEQIQDEINKLKTLLRDTEVSSDIKSTAILTMNHLQELLRNYSKYTTMH